MSDATLQKNNPADLAATEQPQGVTFAPRVDVVETEHELLLFADLPGVSQDSVDIRFEKGELTLHARRTATMPTQGYTHREIDAGDYFRAFRISDKIAADKIVADLKDGVLTLHLPKAEAAKPRKITVKGG